MEENKKNKRKSIAEWIAVFLCIAAAPVPCITLMSATKVLSERPLASIAVFGHWSCRLFDNLQGA